MTQLTSKKIALIAMCFVGSAVALSCFAGTPAPRQDSSNDLSHVVRLGKAASHDGDSITIDEIRGTSETLSVGNTYEVKGTYKLASRDKALLAVFVTTEKSHPGEPHPALKTQKMIIDKGEGHFTLRFHMWDDGKPHVSFYPMQGGESFVSIYF